MIRVIIVDDHLLVREGLRSVLQGAPDIEVVADYASGSPILSESRPAAEVLMLDISMPDADGLSILQALKGRPGAPAVILLTMHPALRYAQEAIRLGARGYLTKDSDQETILQAIRSVALGGLFIHPDDTGALWIPPQGNEGETASAPAGKETEAALEQLSLQERRVFDLIVKGKTIKETAWELGVSDKTVSTYKTRLMAKLGVDSLVGLIKFGMGLPSDAG